jgi:hypothetical protein
MSYLALVNDREISLRDAQEVAEALQRGTIALDSWIKIEDEESDWQPVSEMFPALENAPPSKP